MYNELRKLAETNVTRQDIPRVGPLNILSSSALGGTAVAPFGAALGLVTSPRNYRTEGIGRGTARGLGIGAGMGAGHILARLLTQGSGADPTSVLSLLTQLGGMAGGGFGGDLLARHMIGDPKWQKDDDNADQDKDKSAAVKYAFLDDYAHLLKPGLIGAGVGGLGALGLSSLQKPERRNWLRNLLLGLMLGGGLGAGIGQFRHQGRVNKLTENLQRVGTDLAARGRDVAARGRDVYDAYDGDVSKTIGHGLGLGIGNLSNLAGRGIGNLARSPRETE